MQNNVGQQIEMVQDTATPSEPVPNELSSPEKESEPDKAFEPYVHGIKPGTSAQVTPLKHVNMFVKHFSKEKVEQSIEYLETEGASLAPIFMVVDTRGTWTTKGKKLYWQANDGSTALLEVVPTEELQDFIRARWFQQDLPSGIFSLHHHLCLSYLGVSRAAIKKFIDKQKAWQMVKNLPTKGKARLSMLAKRPFSHIEMDIADMISFQQTHSKDDSRYLFVIVDNFSGFCMAEIQNTKEGPETLRSFNKCLRAIKLLNYPLPKMVRSDQGPEFQGPGWTKLDKKNKWRRELTKNYPATRVERKIQTLKKYCRLNSTLTRGPGTYWFNVVNSSVLATNRIYQQKGGSPLQIVLMDMQDRKEVHEKAKGLRAKRQQNIKRTPHANEPAVGDSVRVRLIGEKELPRDYKGHIAYREGVPVKWSDKLHRVEKKRANKTLGTLKLLVGGRWRFWPSEAQLVPADTEESSMWGQDGNVDFKAQRRGSRRSSRAKRISYKGYY